MGSMYTRNTKARKQTERQNKSNNKTRHTNMSTQFHKCTKKTCETGKKETNIPEIPQNELRCPTL